MGVFARDAGREAEVAWAAGFFDGEGTIQKHSYVAIHSTDLDLLERFQVIVEAGTVKPRKQHRGWQPHWKPQWHWAASGDEARSVLVLLVPFLGNRRAARAEEELASYREVMAPRVCPGCGETFVPPSYACGAAKRRFCNPDCHKAFRVRLKTITGRSLVPVA